MVEKSYSESYAAAGVDITAGYRAVELMKKHVGEQVKVKAAGGISSVADAEQFIALGAERLGTSRLIPLLKDL